MKKAAELFTRTHAAEFRGNDGREQIYLRRSKLVAVLVVIILGLGGAVSRAQKPSGAISIEDAYTSALQTNETILIAEKAISKSKIGLKETYSMMLPHVYFSVGYQQVDREITKSNIFGNFIILPEDQSMAEARVSNSIYDPNYLPARSKAIEQIHMSADSCYQSIQNVLLEVAAQYYNVLRFGKLVRFEELLIKTAREQVRESKVKYSSGAVTEEVPLRAMMDLATAKNNLITYSNKLELAKDTLRRLIGLRSKGLELTKPAQLAQPDESYETLLGCAYQNRLDHKAALSNVRLAEIAVRAVKAKFLPSVKTSWEYYTLNHPRYDQRSSNWAFDISLSMPLLEGGQRVWGLESAMQSLEQARLSLAANRHNIAVEVKNALLTIRNNKSLLIQLQSQMRLARKNYDIVFAKFTHGTATIAEVSQAFTLLNSSKTNFVNKSYNYEISILNLQQAVGIFALNFINKVRLKEVVY